MVNDVIRKRLERLELSISRLKSKQDIPFEEFLKNWEIQDAILREFQIAIETMIDIANHIIAEQGWKSPDSYQDAIAILVERKVIPKIYGKKFSQMVSFRNVIVHEYLHIDLKKVYDNLKRVNDFNEFILLIVNFLKNRAQKGAIS